MEIIDELENKNEVFTVEPLDILDLMEILIPVLQSGPSYLKMEKDMCRQEQESSMTLFQRKNLWRQRIKALAVVKCSEGGKQGYDFNDR